MNEIPQWRKLDNRIMNLSDTDARAALMLLAAEHTDEVREALDRVTRHHEVRQALDRIGEHETSEPGFQCGVCGQPLGIFQGHGDDWRHYTGTGTSADPIVMTNPGHPPVAHWPSETRVPDFTQDHTGATVHPGDLP